MNQLAQTETETVRVWPEQVPDADLWRDIGPALERPRWENSRLVRKVSQPTLTAFRPEPAIAGDTGVIVCPGGAFHFLTVDKEGTEVARWLTARGVTAFVLKYRVVPTPDDDAALLRIAAHPGQYRDQMDKVRPMVVADGIQAVRTVRQQARQWGIDADRLGILGFSAGGFVAAGAATEYDAESRPSFAACIYAGWNERRVPADVPPLFMAAAFTDELVNTQESVSLYAAWKAVGRPAELHLYAKVGYGFGLNRQGLPSDTWIDRFWDWLQAEGFGGINGNHSDRQERHAAMVSAEARGATLKLVPRLASSSFSP
jgi:acetyl esterase/lipase